MQPEPVHRTARREALTLCTHARQVNAVARPRIKGRFVKPQELAEHLAVHQVTQPGHHARHVAAILVGRVLDGALGSVYNALLPPLKGREDSMGREASSQWRGHSKISAELSAILCWSC